jgi:hypothetical protein
MIFLQVFIIIIINSIIREREENYVFFIILFDTQIKIFIFIILK